MSREDFKIFDQIRRERQEKRQKCRDSFGQYYEDIGKHKGWRKHSESHYTYRLNGSILQYWPGPQRWTHQGKKGYGDIHEYIAKRES